MATALLDFSRPHLIKTKKEYEAAMAEIESLMDAESKADIERLEFLAALVEIYEDAHYPVPEVSPQAMVDFRLDQMGMTRTDLHSIMGGKSRVSEFFAGKRDLSIEQIRALCDTLRLTSDLLLGR